MGCDIHCYIEYHDGHDRWSGFGGRINPGRNYRLFGALAGVRTDAIEHVQPRGLPPDIGYVAIEDATLFIGDPAECSGCTTRENADRWLAQGCSRYWDAKQTRVTHPDWHSHSWLKTAEFAGAMERYYRDPYPGEKGIKAIEYEAILASMKCFESFALPARLVFWFDS